MSAIRFLFVIDYYLLAEFVGIGIMNSNRNDIYVISEFLFCSKRNPGRSFSELLETLFMDAYSL